MENFTGTKPILLEQDIYSTIYVSNIAEDIARDIEQEQADHLKNDYKQRLQAQGINWDQLTASQGEEKILENLKEDAIVRIKNSLVIDKIAKEENIAVDFKDLEQQITQVGQAYGLTPQDFMKEFGKNPELLSSLSQQAINNKIKDFLMANNTVEFK